MITWKILLDISLLAACYSAFDWVSLAVCDESDVSYKCTFDAIIETKSSPIFKTSLNILLSRISMTLAIFSSLKTSFSAGKGLLNTKVANWWRISQLLSLLMSKGCKLWRLACGKHNAMLMTKWSDSLFKCERSVANYVFREGGSVGCLVSFGFTASVV